jgi:hypothetical protein
MTSPDKPPLKPLELSNASFSPPPYILVCDCFTIYKINKTDILHSCANETKKSNKTNFLTDADKFLNPKATDYIL